MALRNILTVEEPVLHKTARPVTRFDAHLGELLDDMRQTLTNAGGVGLAAPQIGILRRVVVVDDDGELIERSEEHTSELQSSASSRMPSSA